MMANRHLLRAFSMKSAAAIGLVGVFRRVKSDDGQIDEVFSRDLKWESLATALLSRAR